MTSLEDQFDCFCCILSIFDKSILHGSNLVTFNTLFVFVGSLIKLVYFSRKDSLESSFSNSVQVEEVGLINDSRTYPSPDGKLHFAKFETNKIDECLDFIESKQLHGSGMILSSLPLFISFACPNVLIFFVRGCDLACTLINTL